MEGTGLLTNTTTASAVYGQMAPSQLWLGLAVPPLMATADLLSLRSFSTPLVCPQLLTAVFGSLTRIIIVSVVYGPMAQSPLWQG
jgi:hypothetical protein